MTNNRLDLSRLGRLALWTLYGERGRILTYGVVMTALFAVAIGLALWFSRHEDAETRELSLFLAEGLCTSVYCFGCFVFYTRVFTNLKTKREAVTFLSLPASPLEKWLARVIYACVFLQLVATVSLLLADGLGWLFAQSLGLDYGAGVALGTLATVWKGFSYNLTVGGLRFEAPWLFGVSLNLLSTALVVWASTVFRNPLLSSIGVMATLTLLLVAPGLRSCPWLFGLVGGGWLTFAFYLAVVVMLTAAWWLLRDSYRAFTRREIVTHKWMNL